MKDISFSVAYAYDVRSACRAEDVPHGIGEVISSLCYENSVRTSCKLKCEHRDSTWMLWWTDAEACTRRVVRLDDHGNVLFDIQPPKTLTEY